MKLIKIQSTLTVVFDNGDVIIEQNCTDQLYNELVNLQNDPDKVLEKLRPKQSKTLSKIRIIEKFNNEVETSKYLVRKGTIITIPTISDFSLPTDLVMKIFKVELEGNEDLLTSYLNFWTLVCLNPNPQVRNNIFWFLDRYGMEITKSGLFVAYRNVEVFKEGEEIDHTLTKFITDSFMHVRFKLKKSPRNYFVGILENGSLHVSPKESQFKEVLGVLKDMYDKITNEECDDFEESLNTIYTDNYSKTFRIQIGKIVSLARELCDPDQDVTCSSGLHVGGKTWLKQNYFGAVPLRVLVNPTDVVAVP